MPPKKKRKLTADNANIKNNQNETEAKKKFTKWLMKSEPESRIEKGVDVKFGIEDLKSSPNQTTHWDGVRNYQAYANQEDLWENLRADQCYQEQRSRVCTCLSVLTNVFKARNFMRDQMRIGELAFFYHSNCKEPGIAGIMEVVRESYVDHTQFDKADPHYDPKASKENPKWFMVDVKYVRMMKRFISLKELKKLHLEHKENGGPLKTLALFIQSRLSVAPLTEEEFQFIQSLEDQKE